MATLIKAAALSRVKPAATIAITELGRQLRSQGKSVVSLSIGQPDFDTPEHIKQGAIQAMQRGETKYSPIGGMPELKQAVRDKFQRDNHLTFADNEVTVSAGGKQVITNTLYATLNDGDEVIIPAPYWLAYGQTVRMFNGTPKFVDTPQSDGFKLTAASLEAAISDKTKWLILNSPGNPSGAVYSRAELQALAVVLLKHPHVWILSDDMYEHLVYGNEPFATIAEVEPKLKDRTLTLNGVSKAYAMTGWRIGYAGGPADLIKAMELVQGHTTSGASRICQWAAVTALTGPQDSVAEMRKEYDKRRTLIVNGLNAISRLECLMPEGAFYAYPSCAAFIGGTTAGGAKIETDVDFCMALLLEQGVATVHGAAFGLSPHFRVSYAASETDLHEALIRINKFCAAIS